MCLFLITSNQRSFNLEVHRAVELQLASNYTQVETNQVELGTWDLREGYQILTARYYPRNNFYELRLQKHELTSLSTSSFPFFFNQ